MGTFDEADEIIESSQVPTLRENVRKRRIFYGESSMPKQKYSKRLKNVSAKERNNATVSQCMQQEWRSPRICKRTNQGTKESNGVQATQCDVEEYVKFTTQQNATQGIECDPSVNLFEQQRDVIQRYMLNETSEAQQEEMLDRMLQGFRTSYEQASARILDVSPVADKVNKTAEIVEMVPNSDHQAGHAMNYYEPIVQLVELPEETPEERDDVQPMVIDGCLDLSTKRDKPSSAYCARNETTQKSRNVSNNHFSERMFANEGILDLHMTPTLGEQRTGRGREYVSKFYHQQQQQQQNQQSSYKTTRNASTTEHATQTRKKFSRNAGIQHHPVASFDMTKYNVITLARMVGSSPDSIYLNLKDILAPSPSRALWHPRDLSQVFTQDDPYYANLHSGSICQPALSGHRLNSMSYEE
uniref:Uncharacterized protein n=1 Tax=Anopheles atroparvus TaxID=41427 RepID=A0A182IX36_ANOAO